MKVDLIIRITSKSVRMKTVNYELRESRRGIKFGVLELRDVSKARHVQLKKWEIPYFIVRTQDHPQIEVQVSPTRPDEIQSIGCSIPIKIPVV